ncbi:energy-coupling factor transporter ATPase [Tepidibacillus fermentans]|uniref:Energy-coupling factor transport system ATP-binding protein n=1 Tax=Tepidibacillus fermentans TaxID=1281767 RepID=A0A4R3KEW7_9BACI|nr:energy-coupling factor transporter ATPase [Tepidibacillus fermentans]TCS81519.1 energy-coupling factor transport system ATP-binding protein [Tepidibacillus fermentans]
MEPIIQIKDLTFRYPHSKEEILKNITLDFYKGQFIAVLGPNGSGKSTLAKLLTGILQPEKGSVIVNGKLIQDEEDVWQARKTIGIVFQNPDNQIVATTVEDDVAFGLENQGIPPAEIRIRVDEALTKLGLIDYKQMEPHYLSGGQKQKVAIAGILAMKPNVIIFDEATSMLDPQGRKEVIETARKLNETERITVIHITHFLQETIFADRVIVLNEGKIFFDGTPEEIFAHSQTLKEIGLDVPLPVELSDRLRNRGIPIGEIVNEEELIRKLWTFI